MFDLFFSLTAAEPAFSCEMTTDTAGALATPAGRTCLGNATDGHVYARNVGNTGGIQK